MRGRVFNYKGNDRDDRQRYDNRNKESEDFVNRDSRSGPGPVRDDYRDVRITGIQRSNELIRELEQSKLGCSN